MYELKLTREQNIVLHLAARSISADPSALVLPEEELVDVDWAEILQECNAQTITLAAFDAATPYKAQIPEDLYAKWKNTAMALLTANYQVVQSQYEMIELLGNAYPFIILKGTSAAVYYPKPDLRALGDVDFLIDPTQQEELETLFIRNGFEKSQGDHPNHVVLRKTGSHLEMHFDVAGVPFGWQGDEVRAFLKDCVYAPQSLQYDFCEFPAAEDGKNGFILLLHMEHHMMGDGLGLRHLCDWAAFVNKTKEQAFWQETLLPFLDKIGLLVYAQMMTKTAAKFLQTDCPDWASGADDETCDEIMFDILTGGNFGRKDENRAKSGMLISEHGKDGTKHGALYNLAHALHKAVLRQPIIQKVPILYPFVYVYRACRFLFLSMIGKRPSLLKMLPEAEKRKSVYDKLKIFETENKEK